MAAEIKTRFTIECTGLGAEKTYSCYALMSDVPTQIIGPTIVTVNTAQQLLDTMALVSGTVIGIFLKSLTSGIYFSPFNTNAQVTASIYVPLNQFSWVTLKSTVSAVPSLIASLPGSQVEIIVAGITV